MAAVWYYLEEDDSKKGPFTFEQLLTTAPEDCLISNDDMLNSDTPWVFLSELTNDNDTQTNTDTLINSNTANPQNKHIEIKIQNTNTDNTQSEIHSIDTNTHTQTIKPLPQPSKEQIIKEQKLHKQRKENEAKLKKQVLNIKKDETFDEEWFILSNKDNKETTLGPFTRWQIVKQYNANEINADTITFLNGSKEFRYLKMCGELVGVLPCIELDATVQTKLSNNVKLTKDDLENKQWLYKDAYQRECGPISLSEIFYKLEDGILGRNSEVKQETALTWKTVEFIQKKFSKEWNEMLALKSKLQSKGEDIDTMEIEKSENENRVSDVESDIDEGELEFKYDPSFRALIDLDKQTQIEKKIKSKFPESVPKTTEITKSETVQKKKRKRKRKVTNKKPKQIKSIYVTGLPLDITENEMEQFFKRAGVIATDIYQKGKKMVTLYKKDGKLKGDALVTYHQMCSVNLAMQLLDETEIRTGFPVHIQLAKFGNAKHKSKGKSQAPQRKRRKFNSKEESTLKQLYGVDKELTWDDDITRIVPQLQWVVLRNLWNKQQISNVENVDIFMEELKSEVLSECSKIGAVDKIEVYESNPEGIMKVKFKCSENAAECIEKNKGRYFGGNVLDCFYWDGKRDYKVYETAEQQEKRLESFQRALQNIDD